MLPKVHYSFPLPDWALTPANSVLREFARITHGVSLRGESATPEEVDAAVEACKAANGSGSATAASVAINYSPWHRRFGAALPATDTGETARAEVRLFRARLNAIRDSLTRANQRHSSDIKVSAILLDCERFAISLESTAIDEAINRKHDKIYDIARQVFPDARVEWYGRGSMQPSTNAGGWTPSRYFTLREKGDSYSCPLYEVPQVEATRLKYARTREFAAAHGVYDVTPWIALGAGYRGEGPSREWEFNWDYDLRDSWNLGAEVNNAKGVSDRAGEWIAARVVVFYPSPLDERTPRTFEHFVAYVRGAAGLPEDDHHRVPACRPESAARVGRLPPEGGS